MSASSAGTYPGIKMEDMTDNDTMMENLTETTKKKEDVAISYSKTDYVHGGCEQKKEVAGNCTMMIENVSGSINKRNNTVGSQVLEKMGILDVLDKLEDFAR